MAEVVKASLKELQMAPRKVSEVASLIRGRLVEDAIVILNHTPRSAAKPVLKLVESAKANAINNHGFDTNGLVIDTISVTAGSRLKRYKPVARGMAHPFQKRTSHIYVTLTGNLKPVKKSKEVASSKSEVVKKSETTVTKTKKGDK